MNRQTILDLMKSVLERQGKTAPLSEDTLLREAGFRSLDFSELALRVEMLNGKELSFDAGPLRAIRTVKDVLDFLEGACLASHHPQ